MQVFAALDFETASEAADSVCAVGLVRFEGGVAVQRYGALVRPPSRRFTTSWVHGMTWHDVERAEPFAAAWSACLPLLEGAQALVAHNAAFERRALTACLSIAERDALPPWVCTLALARRTWSFERYDLATVCRRLGIPLRHHDALSDAEACGGVLLRAEALRETEQSNTTIADARRAASRRR